MTKVLVCGGRSYDRMGVVKATLDAIHAASPISCVVSGGAAGADTLGERWAEGNRIPVMRFPAPWSVMGNAAGTVRNMWMLEHGQPGLVVAFPGGAGTADMIRKARRAGVTVQVVT